MTASNTNYGKTNQVVAWVGRTAAMALTVFLVIGTDSLMRMYSSNQGVPMDTTFMVSAVVGSVLIFSVCNVFVCMAIQRIKAKLSGKEYGLSHMPAGQAVEEIRSVAPYLAVTREQLKGALQESEQGVMSLIRLINQVHQVSDNQVVRIQKSHDNGAEITRVMEEKLMIDKQLSAILEMFADKQTRDIEDNMSRIKRLQEVKALAPLVDVIAIVARQTNLLSVNAAIEAARAGESGRGFAVVAAEIRQLSIRTASAANDIAQRINSATESIDEELDNAMNSSSREDSSGSMRRVIQDIAAMQERFAGASQKLMGILDGVKNGHQEIVQRLSEALGYIQFHDVMRQRVEPVEQALQELNEHLQSMADQMVDKPWNPEAMVYLKQRLDEQVTRYVMQSQLQTHQKITGDVVVKDSARPKIELF
jgi:methyl-accepting chemotaxis protein